MTTTIAPAPAAPATPAASTTATPAAAPPPTAPDLSADFAKLQATIAAQGATIQQLSDENARRRNETKAEREAREAADIAGGNYKTRAERLEAENAEALRKIATLEPEVQEWRTQKQTIIAQVEAEGAALPAAFAPAFSLAQSLDQKRAIIAAAKASTFGPPPVAPTEPPKVPGSPAPLGGAPAATPAPTANVDPRTMTVEQIQALQKTNPAAFAAMFGRQASEKPRGILDIIGLR